ncbi:uncharacterized protein F4812DRAFT_455807 [Daldinia caldariorum]|uniref:uncharacterized protein n=1 Tax=Daldinia caldariorum TaxID=326644 RepID=UPI00200840D8|nr:uncharacterized protein F4812DRAFT_455807 [Daldinia caldariorum]KAI1471698.1 hypothetical protein F4812DRAFT_455807 [Daldinia caldariorum]
MATLAQGEEEPPPYIPDNRNDGDDILPPSIFVLDGQFIRAQTADGAPLYELSRDVRKAPTSEARLAQVTLERLIRNVRISTNGTPRVTSRSRHIFELKHLPPVISTGFPYVLDAMSRQCVGNLALKPASFPRSGYKVVKTKPEKESGFPKGYQARRESIKGDEVLFEILKKHDHYEWMHAADGSRIAVEDEMDNQHRLIVTTPITRKMTDAMVASWTLRIWRDGMKAHREPRIGGDKGIGLVHDDGLRPDYRETLD